MFKCMDPKTNEDKKCMVLQDSAIVCKKPDTCCAYAQQFCCYEERAAFPCTKDVPCMFTCLPGCVVMASSKPKFACCAQVKDIFAGDDMNWSPPSSEGNELNGKQKDLSDVDTQDLLVCNACCCTIGSLFCKMPDCIGVKSEGKCLCISGEMAACKPVAEKNDEGVCCICTEAGQYCVQPDTCIMGQAQYFCLDYRCAFPCNEKVPCVCAFCFLVVHPKPGCMKKVGEFTGTEVKEAQLG